MKYFFFIIFHLFLNFTSIGQSLLYSKLEFEAGKSINHNYSTRNHFSSKNSYNNSISKILLVGLSPRKNKFIFWTGIKTNASSMSLKILSPGLSLNEPRFPNVKVLSYSTAHVPLYFSYFSNLKNRKHKRENPKWLLHTTIGLEYLTFISTNEITDFKTISNAQSRGILLLNTEAYDVFAWKKSILFHIDSEIHYKVKDKLSISLGAALNFGTESIASGFYRINVTVPKAGIIQHTIIPTADGTTMALKLGLNYGFGLPPAKKLIKSQCYTPNNEKAE